MEWKKEREDNSASLWMNSDGSIKWVPGMFRKLWKLLFLKETSKCFLWNTTQVKRCGWPKTFLRSFSGCELFQNTDSYSVVVVVVVVIVVIAVAAAATTAAAAVAVVVFIIVIVPVLILFLEEDDFHENLFRLGPKGVNFSSNVSVDSDFAICGFLASKSCVMLGSWGKQ